MGIYILQKNQNIEFMMEKQLLVKEYLDYSNHKKFDEMNTYFLHQHLHFGVLEMWD